MVQAGNLNTKTAMDVQEAPRTPENKTPSPFLESAAYKQMSDEELMRLDDVIKLANEEDCETTYDSDDMCEYMTKEMLATEVVVTDPNTGFVTISSDQQQIMNSIILSSNGKPPQVHQKRKHTDGSSEIIFESGLQITCGDKKSTYEIINMLKKNLIESDPVATERIVIYGGKENNLLTNDQVANATLIKTILIAYFTLDKDYLDFVKSSMNKIRDHLTPECSHWAEVEQQVASAGITVIQNLLSRSVPVLNPKFIPDVLAYRKNMKEYHRRKCSMGDFSF